MKLWFKAKRYGWGWTPITWQGWLVILLYVVVLIGTVSDLSNRQITLTPLEIAWKIILVIIATTALIYICYRTGEKPGWRWGDKGQNKAKK